MQRSGKERRPNVSRCGQLSPHAADAVVAWEAAVSCLSGGTSGAVEGSVFWKGGRGPPVGAPMGALREMLGEGVYLWTAGGCRAGGASHGHASGRSHGRRDRGVRFSMHVACRPAAPDARTPAGMSPQSGKSLTCRISASGGRWQTWPAVRATCAHAFVQRFGPLLLPKPHLRSPQAPSKKATS